MAAYAKTDASGAIYGKVTSLLDGSILAVLSNSNWKAYLSEISSLPASLKDKCLYLMSKRGWLNDDNISMFLHAKVRKLDLADCEIGDRGVLAVKQCPQLLKLDLNANKESRTTVTSDAIRQLAEACTHLQTVYLRRCLNITDDAIVTLSRSCPQLRLLNLGGCQQLTDESLQALGEYSKYLSSLNVSQTKVTDNGMISLVSGQCAQSLNEIHINGCQAVTDEGVEAVLQFCPQISILIFHGCPNITDIQYRKGATGQKPFSDLSRADYSPTGKEIHINGCQAVTDEGVEAVLQFCPQISIFIFHGCPNITEQSRLALEELSLSRSKPMKQITWTIY